MKQISLLLFFVCFLLVRTSYAQQWVSQTSGTSNALLAVDFIDASNGYAAGNSGTVIKTTNGGTTWTPVNITTSYPITDLHFASADTGWACAGDVNDNANTGKIWKTVDGGTNWVPQTPSSTEARLGLSFSSSNVGWAVGSHNGTILLDATTNGGGSWTQQSNSNIFGWIYKNAAINATTCVAVGGAFFPSVSGLLIRTTDGSTWNQVSIGTQPFLYAVNFPSSTIGFVAGDQGTILTTVNGGAGWTNQVSNVTVVLEGISFVDVNKGWACGDSGKIVYTQNGGTLWASQATNTTAHLNDISTVDGENAWVVGNDGTVLKYNTSTGINNMSALKTLMVYPNPASEQVIVSFDVNSAITYIISNVVGQEVKRVDAKAGTCNISIASIPKGNYNITAIANGKPLAKAQFVIQ